MTLRVRAAVRSGFDRLFTRAGAILVVVFGLFALANYGFMLSVGTTYVPTPTGLPAGGVTGADGIATPQPGTELPKTAAIQATFLAAVAGTVLSHPLQIVAIRTLVAGVTQRVPGDAVFYRLGRATAHALVGTFATAAFTLVAVLAGGVGAIKVLLLLDGPVSYVLAGVVGVAALVLLAFVLVSLLFISHEIAVRDRGVVGAMRRSWGLSRGSRLRLAVLFVGVTLLQLAIVGSISAVLADAIAALGAGVASATIGVATTAVFAAAYDQLADSPTAAWR